MTNEQILNKLEAIEEEKDFKKALTTMKELDSELNGKLEFNENVYTREYAQDMIDNDNDDLIDHNLPDGELFWYDAYEERNFTVLDHELLNVIVSNYEMEYENY